MFGIAGAIIGGVSAAVAAGSAVQNHKDAKAAQKSAEKASNTALAFSKEQYEDWKNVYGPIQDRLSDYYMSLNPSDFAAQGIDTLTKQYNQVITNLDASLNRKGVTTPAADSIKAQLGLDYARQKAEVRQQAPLQVAQAQQGFLSQSVSNPGASAVLQQMNANTNQALQRQAKFEGLEASAGQALGNTITNTLKSYYDNKAYQDRTKALASQATGL